MSEQNEVEQLRDKLRNALIDNQRLAGERNRAHVAARLEVGDEMSKLRARIAELEKEVTWMNDLKEPAIDAEIMRGDIRLAENNVASLTALCTDMANETKRMRERIAELEARADDKIGELDRYDAGYLNGFGGGNVAWWHDYMRSELDRAHDYYAQQYDQRVAELEAMCAPLTAKQIKAGEEAKIKRLALFRELQKTRIPQRLLTQLEHMATHKEWLLSSGRSIAELEARQVVPEWSHRKPTAIGAYWVRGFVYSDPCHMALVHVIEGYDESLWCNLHSDNTDPHGYEYRVSVLDDEFEWFGPLTAAPTPPAVQAVPEPAAAVIAEMRDEHWPRMDDFADRLERAQWPAQDVARDGVIMA